MGDLVWLGSIHGHPGAVQDAQSGFRSACLEWVAEGIALGTPLNLASISAAILLAYVVSVLAVTAGEHKHRQKGDWATDRPTSQVSLTTSASIETVDINATRAR
ncbi:hypothetical protein LA080_004182 [Diaporthe eres]|nr:hypothetical protein LA080_004182 [Diaporthe eres]